MRVLCADALLQNAETMKFSFQVECMCWVGRCDAVLCCLVLSCLDLSCGVLCCVVWCWCWRRDVFVVVYRCVVLGQIVLVVLCVVLSCITVSCVVLHYMLWPKVSA